MRIKCITTLLVVYLLMASLVPAMAGESGNAVLAKVDGSEITRQNLEDFFNAFFYREEAREKLKDLPEFQKQAVLARGRSEALSKLIERHLLLDAARNQFLTDEQVSKIVEELTEKRVEEIKDQTDSWVGFVESLQERGVSLRQWKQFLRETILIQNFIYERTRASRRIRPVEMRRYYRNHRDQFRRPRQIVYRLIVVDPERCEKGKDEEDLAKQLRQKLLAGADFARLAEKYSIDRDQTEGGLHRVKAPKEDPDWMPPVCRGLEPGELSEVTKTKAGCSIARLEKVVPEHTATYEEVQEGIRQRLLETRQREARKGLVEDLREQGSVEILPEGQEIMGS